MASSEWHLATSHARHTGSVLRVDAAAPGRSDPGHALGGPSHPTAAGCRTLRRPGTDQGFLISYRSIGVFRRLPEGTFGLSQVLCAGAGAGQPQGGGPWRASRRPDRPAEPDQDRLIK